jgi:signal transduction histidine kinase
MARWAKIGAIVVLHDVTREKLVESMKSEFVTVAAHQLRTPTSGIKWSLGMLKDGDLGALSKEQKEIIGKAYETNEKVIHLIADLLNVARIEEGKYLNKITLSSVEDLIRSLVAEYEEEIKKRKLKFEFKKPKEELPRVMMDVDKMKIAVGNLIDNAIRYTLAEGKISISIAKKDEEQIEVQIKDTGLGIPQNQQNKMFTKFFRGDNIMKVETEGTGLGLFITKSIIEAHGGKIWFDSEENKGTAFYFTVPIKEKFAEFITPELY